MRTLLMKQSNTGNVHTEDVLLEHFKPSILRKGGTDGQQKLPLLSIGIKPALTDNYHDDWTQSNRKL